MKYPGIRGQALDLKKQMVAINGDKNEELILTLDEVKEGFINKFVVSTLDQKELREVVEKRRWVIVRTAKNKKCQDGYIIGKEIAVLCGDRKNISRRLAFCY
jgi:hypothetical protein